MNIAQIKERLKNATAGPWLSDGSAVKTREDAVYGYPPTDGVICGLDDGEYIENKNYKNDVVFIANAPTDISYLLSIIEQAKKALSRLYLACPPPEPPMFIEEGYNEEEYVEAVGEAIEALKAIQGDET